MHKRDNIWSSRFTGLSFVLVRALVLPREDEAKRTMRNTNAEIKTTALFAFAWRGHEEPAAWRRCGKMTGEAETWQRVGKSERISRW